MHIDLLEIELGVFSQRKYILKKSQMKLNFGNMFLRREGK